MTVYTYEEYKNKVLNLLYQEYEPDIVKKINVPGSNGKNAEGVCLCFGTNSASPIIYFDSDKVSCSDEDVQAFVGKVRDEYCEFMKFLKEEPDDMSWKKMKRRIFPRVLNYDRNKEILENVPYMKYMDFAVCFFYNTKSESEHGAMTIGNEMQEIWNVTLEELFEASVENLKKLDCSMKNLDEVAAMCGLDVNEDKSVPLYTLSVYTGIFGAAVKISNGSPSRIRIVLRISFGITTLPKSSILLTIPVAFIYTKTPLFILITMLLSVICGNLYCVFVA